jgi:thiol-disulfide isomerase/thioredoxin
MAQFKQILIYAGIALLAVTAGLLLRGQLIGGSPSTVSESVATKGSEAIFAAVLPDLQGTSQRISQWRGKVLVVNFWASWCEPCRKEIPEFIEIQNQFRDQGLVFVGIAVDQPQKAAAFSQDIGINYPVLTGGMEAMSLAEAAGNRQGALPFTVIIDRSGKIISTHLGLLSRSKLEATIKPLL